MWDDISSNPSKSGTVAAIVACKATKCCGKNGIDCHYNTNKWICY